jgi:hypothetical protein
MYILPLFNYTSAQFVQFLNLLGFVTMGGIPSVPRDRTRTLKVIGAGYSRTGTLSMAMALERLLDGPVMHGGSQLLGREDGTSCSSPLPIITNGI